MVYLPRGRKSEPPRILYAFFFYLSCCFHCVLCVVCAHETPRLDAYAVSCFFSRCHKSSSERCYRIPNDTFYSSFQGAHYPLDSFRSILDFWQCWDCIFFSTHTAY